MNDRIKKGEGSWARDRLVGPGELAEHFGPNQAKKTAEDILKSTKGVLDKQDAKS